MVDDNKIGSKHWLYLACVDLLPPHIIISGKPPQSILSGIEEILYLDDIIITGESFCSTIGQFKVDIRKEQIIKLGDQTMTRYKNKRVLNQSVVVIAAVMTLNNFVYAYHTNMKIYNDIKIFPFDKYMLYRSDYKIASVFKELIDAWVAEKNPTNLVVMSNRPGLAHWLDSQHILPLHQKELTNVDHILYISDKITNDNEDDELQHMFGYRFTQKYPTKNIHLTAVVPFVTFEEEDERFNTIFEKAF